MSMPLQCSLNSIPSGRRSERRPSGTREAGKRTLLVRGGGFSLIEVLIAMVVLGLGAASLVALFAAGSSTHKRSVDRTRAALVAERVFGEAQFLYTHGVTPRDLTRELRQKLPEEIDGYRHQVVAFRPGGDEWSDLELYVQVEIRWKRSGRARTETFATILLPRATWEQ